jgi:hypothetical protein
MVHLEVAQEIGLRPGDVRRALPARYRLESFVIEIEGEVSRRERNLWLMASRNRMAFGLGRRQVERGREEEAERPLREIAAGLEEGHTLWSVRGEVGEERGRLVLLVESARRVERRAEGDRPERSESSPRPEPGRRPR